MSAAIFGILGLWLGTTNSSDININDAHENEVDKASVHFRARQKQRELARIEENQEQTI